MNIVIALDLYGVITSFGDGIDWNRLNELMNVWSGYDIESSCAVRAFVLNPHTTPQKYPSLSVLSEGTLSTKFQAVDQFTKRQDGLKLYVSDREQGEETARDHGFIFCWARDFAKWLETLDA